MRTLTENVLKTRVVDFSERRLIVVLREYVEGLVGHEWIDEQCRLHEAWAARNSNRFLQITLGHKAVGTNHLVALMAATRAGEADPADWLGWIPTAARREIPRPELRRSSDSG